jgi:Domain of unknown function (DUF309)
MPAPSTRCRPEQRTAAFSFQGRAELGRKLRSSLAKLEEAWTPERGRRRQFLQALIHLAGGLYHRQRDNPVGAVRQLQKGLKKLAAYVPSCEGMDTARLPKRF